MITVQLTREEVDAITVCLWHGRHGWPGLAAAEAAAHSGELPVAEPSTKAMEAAHDTLASAVTVAP
jgi:hypothetical protein